MSRAANDGPLPRIQATPCSRCGLTVRGVPRQTYRLHLPESVPIDRTAQCRRSGPRGDVLLADRGHLLSRMTSPARIIIERGIRPLKSTFAAAEKIPHRSWSLPGFDRR